MYKVMLHSELYDVVQQARVGETNMNFYLKRHTKRTGIYFKKLFGLKNLIICILIHISNI